MTFKSFFKRNEKQLKTWAFVIIGLAILLRYTNADLTLQLGTQSVFGGAFGFGVSFALLLVLIGTVLIIIPEPATTVTGIAMVIAGLVLGYGSIAAILNDIFGDYSSIFMIGGLIFIGYLAIRNLFK